MTGEPIEEQINDGVNTIIHDENVMLVIIIILLLLVMFPLIKRLFLYIMKNIKKVSTPLLSVETNNENENGEDNHKSHSDRRKMQSVNLNELVRKINKIEEYVILTNKRMDSDKEEKNIFLKQLMEINSKISESQTLDNDQNNKINGMEKMIKRNRYVTMETLCQIKIFMKDLAVKERLDAGHIYTKKLKKNGHTKKLVARLERAYNEYQGDDKDLFTVDF